MSNDPREEIKVRRTMRELLMDPQKKKGEAENFLAIVLRDIFAMHQILPTVWERLMDRYYRQRYGDDIKKISQEKTNLQRALSKNKLTADRFETAIQILGVKSYTFTTTLEDSYGHKHNHSVKTRNRFALSKVGDDDEEDDKDE